MDKTLLSLGLDVGTSTTGLILSELTVQNRASGFCVPQMVITDRRIRYKSPIIFTPLQGHNLVDGEKLKDWVLEQYRAAGVTRRQVDTGAVIITGESSRKENAREVLGKLSGFAGDFVVATAGPDLESVLSAKGAGAEALSQKEKTPVLHMDIGGGTSNLTLLKNGRAVKTGCLNVGGRLIKMEGNGVLTYVSPVLQGLFEEKVGTAVTKDRRQALARLLARVLEMGAGLRPADDSFRALLTREAGEPWEPPEERVVLSFSGGVAACIGQEFPDLAFGDIGPQLGKAIRESRLCEGTYRCAPDAIRATVIGAGSHTTQLSGSTVFWKNVTFPKKNLPVAVPARLTEQGIKEALSLCDSPEAVLYWEGKPGASYAQIREMARLITRANPGPYYVAMGTDMGKALGQAVSLLAPDAPCLCLDGLSLQPGDYLDVGAPVGPCFPVVIKSLIFNR